MNEEHCSNCKYFKPCDLEPYRKKGNSSWFIPPDLCIRFPKVEKKHYTEYCGEWKEIVNE